ncbi:MAG: stage 0 sporulation protein [Clostridia bacterium]|nr:stage 0 sporulation protein [Clostridia bacterium]
MEEILGVRFTKTGRLHYFYKNNLEVKVGDTVVASSERGLDLGRVVSIKDKENIALEQDESIGKVERIATKDDIDKQRNLDSKAREVLDTCKKLAKRYNLDMKFIKASYTFDESKLTCYFVAEDRVDFREVVKSLAAEYRTRIELRQVGPRDEIKAYDNIGSCGKEVCCRTFLPDFETVNIKMAKEQGLQINMQKLSGNCGRLKCCLKYEEEVYKEKLKELPKVNAQVKYNGETCKVVALDILKERVRLKIGPQGEERFEMVDVKDIEFEPRKAESKEPKKEQE